MCHANKGRLCGQIVRKRTRYVICVTFTPKAVHHQIHVFQVRIITEFRGKEFIQFGKGPLKFRRVVSGLVEIKIGMVLFRFVADIDNGTFSRRKSGIESFCGWILGLDI
jgi:hypothetical protein